MVSTRIVLSVSGTIAIEKIDCELVHVTISTKEGISFSHYSLLLE